MFYFSFSILCSRKYIFFLKHLLCCLSNVELQIHVWCKLTLISFYFSVYLQLKQCHVVKRISFRPGQRFLGFIVCPYFAFSHYSLSLLNVLPYLSTIFLKTGNYLTPQHPPQEKAVPAELSSFWPSSGILSFTCSSLMFSNSCFRIVFGSYLDPSQNFMSSEPIYHY